MNEWLTDALRGHQKDESKSLGLRLVDATIEALDTVLVTITDSPRTKALVSVPDAYPSATNLRFVFDQVQRALCVAETVILVPAPTWVSCDWVTVEPYREFSGGAAGQHVPGSLSVFYSFPLLESLGRLFALDQNVAQSGAVTFLPLMGSWSNRWDDERLALPALPHPYHGVGSPYTSETLHTNAVCDLLTERMVAKRLNSVHLNPHSFGESVIDDFEVGADNEGRMQHAIARLRVPMLSQLPINELIAVRGEVSESFRALSKSVLQKSTLRTGNAPLDQHLQLFKQAATERTQALFKDYKALRDKSELLKAKLLIKTSTFALATGGFLGDSAKALSFLIGGGAVWDLVDLISTYRSTRLHFRSKSLLAAIKRLHINGSPS